MVSSRRQDAEVIFRNLTLHEHLIWLGQGICSQPDLDGDFPVARRADLDVVEGVLDNHLGRGAQLWVVQQEPKERMGVQK
jgi:hypothetical protein